MTDRRPPHDAPPQDEPESAPDGKRSGARPAPRSTFSDPDAAKKAARVESGPVQTPPRSVFQQAPGARPAADADVTVKRAYPGAWGSTILVNGAPPPAPSPDEKTVRVDRNKLPATMMQGSEEPQASAGDTNKPRSVAPPPPPPATSARPPAPPAAAEPLRVPSNRPVPAPAPKRAASGTLLMPGAAEEVMAQARKQAAAPTPPADAQATKPRAATPDQSAEAQQRPRRATPAQPQASTPMSESSNARTPARAPESPATAQRPASPAKTEVLNPVKKTSEPIRLALDARDQMLEAQTSVGSKVPRNRAPLMIAGAVVLVLVVVAIIAALKHGSSTTAVTEPAVDGTRASAVPADHVPAAVQQPTAPAQPAAGQQQPSAPAAPAVKPQPAAPKAAAEPVQKKAEPAHAQKAEPAREPVAKTPAPAAKPKHEAKPAAEESGEVLDAREALKGLDQAPVVKVKKKSAEDDFTDRALQDAINRPPAPSSDEPVLKVKREPSNDEPPPPAP
jgi:hypothetical protein